MLPLSLVYPIFNRTSLFANTLSTIAQQSLPPDEYEILVIDDGGTCPDLLPLLETYRAHGLPIKYAKIDVTKLPYPLYQYEGANNPAPANNVGIIHAQGERVVLTSPEILQSLPTNLLRLATWPLERNEALIADVVDPSMVTHPQLVGYLSGGPRKRPLHFLAAFHRDFLLRMGGFEERFISGWGFEDSEFVHRFVTKHDGRYVFTGESVYGFHQPHYRVEDADKTGVQTADDLATELQNDPNYIVANSGHPWGNPALIVDAKWWDAA